MMKNEFRVTERVSEHSWRPSHRDSKKLSRHIAPELYLLILIIILTQHFQQILKLGEVIIFMFCQ